MKPLLVMAILVGCVPFLTAQAVPVRWEALHYSLKLGLVSASGETMVKVSSERTELFLIVGSPGDDRVWIAVEPGYGNTEKPGPGTVDVLAGLSGSRYRCTVRPGTLAVTRQPFRWTEEPNHIALTGDPVLVMTLPLADQRPPAAGKTVEARDLFVRDLSLQPRRLHGEDVWVLQRCLVEQGYTDVGEVDGWFGPATRKAVLQFQQAVGLPATGAVDAETWKTLAGPDDQTPNYEGD